MQLLGMLMQQKQNQDALALREKEFQAQQGQQDISNEFTRGRFLAENADRSLRAQEYNANLNAMTARQGAGERSTALRGALELAASGADVDTSYLPPNERAIVESAKAQAQDELGRQYATAAQAAEAVNRKLRAEALVKSLKESGNDKISWFNPTKFFRTRGWDDEVFSKDVADAKAMEAQLPDLSARASAVLSDPNLKQSITFDPASGQYVPIVPKPRMRGVPTVSGNGPVGPVTTDQSLPAFADAGGSAAIPFVAPNTAVPKSDNTFVGRATERAKRTAPRIVRQGNNVFQLMPDGSYQFIQRTEGSGTNGYKDGGTVHGRGTPTSDNITAKVSPGEFIMPAEAMEIPGAPEAMDHMRQTALQIRAARSKPMHMATGGMIPGGNPMSMLMPGMGGGNPMAMLPMMGGSNFNMMMPWLSLLSQPGFMKDATKAPTFARGGVVPHFAWGGMVDDAMGSMGDMSTNAASAVQSGGGGGFNWLGLVMSFLKAKNANQQKPNPIYNWDGIA